jgi:hypothetical protein
VLGTRSLACSSSHRRTVLRTPRVRLCQRPTECFPILPPTQVSACSERSGVCTTHPSSLNSSSKMWHLFNIKGADARPKSVTMEPRITGSNTATLIWAMCACITGRAPEGRRRYTGDVSQSLASRSALETRRSSSTYRQTRGRVPQLLLPQLGRATRSPKTTSTSNYTPIASPGAIRAGFNP